jgi:predicted transposase/invertase (TIGR01784 family)
MTNRYLDPTNDVAFKRVFSDKEILMDFLNSAMHLENEKKIIDLEYIESEEVPDIGQGKRSMFDIKVTDQSNRKYIVEMQNSPESSFLNRVQLYASHSYVSQARQGDHQNKGLMPIIALVITKKNVFPKDVPCISYHDTIESATKKRYLFALSYVFIELKKFHKGADKLENPRDYWLYYLSQWEQTTKPPENIKDIQVLRAYEEIERFNWTEAQYDAYFRAKLALEAYEEKLSSSYEQGLAKGEEKGIQKGMAKGEEKGELKKQIEIAKKMAAKGFGVKDISDLTGFSLNELRKHLPDEPILWED